MGARDDLRRAQAARGPSGGGRSQQGGDPISVEEEDGLAVIMEGTVGASASDDPAGEPSEDDEGAQPAEGDDPDEVGDEPDDGEDGFPTDSPLGLTAVRLPARGRRRGRPGTIF